MGSCKEEGKRFCQTTSLKGVPRLMRNQPALLRTIWTVAVISFLLLTLYQAFLIITKYYRFPTVTKITEKSTDFSEAPDIAICNSHPLSFLSDEAKNNNMSSLKEFHQHLDALTNCSNCSTEELEGRSILQEELSSPYGYYQFIGKEMAKAVSHHQDDILVECKLVILKGTSFIHVPCEGRVNITHHMSVNNFNCYHVHAAVPTYGFSFVSYIDNMDDINGMDLDFESGINTNTGMVIYLLEKQTLWSSSTMQTWLSPGTFNNVQFVVQKKDSPGTPYETCQIKEEVRIIDSFKMSYTPCINFCEETEIAKVCKCKDPTVMSFLDKFGLMTDLPYCGNLTAPKEMVLKYKSCADKNASKRVEYCAGSCPVTCSSLRYTPSLSSTPWPSHHSLKSFYKMYIKGRRYESHFTSAWQQMLNGSKQQLYDLANKNFVKYQIIPTDFRYLQIENVPQVTLSNLLSQLGGTFNLLSGISVFVFIEILELFIRLCSSDKSSQHIDSNKTDKKKIEDQLTKKDLNNEKQPINTISSLTSF